MFPFLILHNYNWTWFHRLKRDFPSFFIMGSAAVRMRSGAECCPAWSFKASGLVQYVRKHLKRWDFLSFFKIGSAAARKRKSQFNYKTLSFEIYDKKFFLEFTKQNIFQKRFFRIITYLISHTKNDLTFVIIILKMFLTWTYEILRFSFFIHIFKKISHWLSQNEKSHWNIKSKFYKN